VVALVAGPIALPGCPDTCGGIAVLYPFGIGQGCFHEGFNLTCQKQHRTKLLLGDGTEVLDISLPDGTVRIYGNIFRSASADFNGTWSGQPATGPFTVSSRYNWFVAYGCNILAQLVPYGTAVGNVSTCAWRAWRRMTAPPCVQASAAVTRPYPQTSLRMASKSHTWLFKNLQLEHL
jgi:hypothetical protein